MKATIIEKETKQQSIQKIRGVIYEYINLQNPFDDTKPYFEGTFILCTDPGKELFEGVVIKSKTYSSGQYSKNWLSTYFKPTTKIIQLEND